MRKILRIILIIIIVGFIIIQFFRPEKNLGQITDNDILSTQPVPDKVAVILKESCFDCHSDKTRYLWYHKIAPVSWMINNHIKEGKHELNFSEWGGMDIFEKITTLEEIAQESSRKTMPLKSYLIMHPKAKLSDEQIKTIEEWTTKLSEELLEGAVN